MSDLVKKCIDLDEWKYSWYNDLKELEDFEKARDVIMDKIKNRISQLQILRDGLDEADRMIALKLELLADDVGLEKDE